MADAMRDEREDRHWTVRLEAVQRIVSDDPDIEGEDLFSVEFEADGPDMNARLEVLVNDVADEAQVVVEALDTLRDALETWARVVARKNPSERIEPDEE